jgi:hypothetical protein
MFNDQINVRVGNSRRKQAMARAAQKMMLNRGRASGAAGLFARAGGGLGRQFSGFRPPRKDFSPLARLAQGGRGGVGAAIQDFGITERQPGAVDPGAVPDLGGIGSILGSGQLPAGPSSVPFGGTTGNTAQDQALIGAEQKYGTPGSPTALSTATQQSMLGSTPGAQLSDIVPGGSGTPRTFEGGGQQAAPTGYVMWQGQLIPSGLFRSLQMTGELW